MALPCIDEAIAALLESAALRHNTPRFVDNDPVQFPRRYAKLQDAEVVALLTSTMAWGRRDMILRDAERMLKRMGPSPYRHATEDDLSGWGSENVHRTLFGRDVRHYLKALRLIYGRHESLNSFFLSHGAESAWDVARLLGEQLTAANGTHNSRCLPIHLENSALKRVNLMLRWMVRDDGIVDLGRWNFITPAQLCIPLDTHVLKTAVRFGLLKSRTPSRRAALALTDVLRPLRPEDPVYYDFALFGLGLEETARNG